MYLAGEPFSFSCMETAGGRKSTIPHPREGRNFVARGNLCLATTAERYGGGRTNLPLTRAKPAGHNEGTNKGTLLSDVGSFVVAYSNEISAAVTVTSSKGLSALWSLRVDKCRTTR